MDFSVCVLKDLLFSGFIDNVLSTVFGHLVESDLISRSVFCCTSAYIINSLTVWSDMNDRSVPMKSLSLSGVLQDLCWESPSQMHSSWWRSMTTVVHPSGCEQQCLWILMICRFLPMKHILDASRMLITFLNLIGWFDWIGYSVIDEYSCVDVKVVKETNQCLSCYGSSKKNLLVQGSWL